MTHEQKLISKDERELRKDPLAYLNKARTRRLEEAFFAQQAYEKKTMEFIEDELQKDYNFQIIKLLKKTNVCKLKQV